MAKETARTDNVVVKEKNIIVKSSTDKNREDTLIKELFNKVKNGFFNILSWGSMTSFHPLNYIILINKKHYRYTESFY